MRWSEVALRLALIAGLFGAILCNVSTWITAPLGLVSIAATSELAVRPYATNATNDFFLSCGATVTTFIIAGLGLSLTPWGLTRTTWSATSLDIISVGVLIRRRGARTSVKRLSLTGVWPLIPWMVLASLILIVAVILALAGVRDWDEKPLLAFSVVSMSHDSAVVEIEATSITGKYRIMATSNTQKAVRYSSPLLTIRAGNSEEQIKGACAAQRCWYLDDRSSVSRSWSCRPLGQS